MRYENALQIGLLYFIVAYLFVINNASIWCVIMMMGLAIWWMGKSLIILWREP